MSWTPPDGMLPIVAQRWRAFYADMARGDAGYTLTAWEYRMLYIAQKGRCWICQRAKGIHPDDPKGRGTRRLAVDHNHATGAVRGLLCSGGDKTCNRIIGWLNAAALQRAANYVTKPPALVLMELDVARKHMEEAGETCTDEDMERLAIAYLWRDLA
jgi:hypothetical protein